MPVLEWCVCSAACSGVVHTSSGVVHACSGVVRVQCCLVRHAVWSGMLSGQACCLVRHAVWSGTLSGHACCLVRHAVWSRMLSGRTCCLVSIICKLKIFVSFKILTFGSSFQQPPAEWLMKCSQGSI